MIRRISAAAPAAIAVVVAAVIAAALVTAPPVEAQACAASGVQCNDGVRCTQQIDLLPGWNAVFLEVQPEPAETEAVFQGIPVESVWAWNPRFSTVDFIRDPDEGVLEETGWLGYRPPSRPDAFLTNLFSVAANRPYLIKLGGTQPVCWQVTGRPSLRRVRWVPNSFNLVGMGIDPGSSITFEQFFAPSRAHAGQPVYRLVPGETTWKLAGCADPATCAGSAMRSGEAFWVYTDGASDYSGPMHVETELGDGLDFGQSLEELELRITNRGASPRSFEARLLNGDASVVAYRKFTNTEANPAEVSFPSVDSGVTVPDDLLETSAGPAGPAAPGQETRLRLAVRRSDFATEVLESVLEITDGAGCRRLVPLSAGVLGGAPALPGGAAPAARASGPRTRSHGTGSPLHGLWVGLVTLDQVAEVHSASDSETPTPTDRIGDEEKPGSTFSFRLILHVDESGQVRLLREVTQMWQDGTPATETDPGTPGFFVLVTRDDKLLEYKGSALRDGELVGRRISTAAYDFDADSGTAWDASTWTLEMEAGGQLAPGGILEVGFVLAADSPTNPFFHRYHDRHNSKRLVAGSELDAPEEIYEIDRSITLQIDDTDPLPDMNGESRPAWGHTLLSGSYAETFAAGSLHKEALRTAGTFELRRVTEVGVLNSELEP